MAANNFDLKGFLNDPKVQQDKVGAIKFLQQKGVIDTKGNVVGNVSDSTGSPTDNGFNTGIKPLDSFVNGLSNVGVGIGSAIGQAGLGIGQAATKLLSKGASAVGLKKTGDFLGDTSKNIGDISKQAFVDPFKKELNTMGGTVGNVVGGAVPFVESGAGIVKAQKYIGGLTKDTPYLIKLAGQVAPEILGTGATQYGVSGGDAKSAGIAGGVAGILSSITHVGADTFNKLIPQSLKDNVARSLRYIGKTTLGEAANQTKVKDGIGAYTTIARLAPEMKVIDKNGVEKVFDPTKTDFQEFPQAVYQAKNKIYEAYTALARKAGETVGFGQKEFDNILNSLDKYKDAGYTSTFTTKANQFKEALLRFGKVNKDGSVSFENVDPMKIQDLIQNFNKDVNPGSDRAGAQVANDLTTEMRGMLDKKIEGATGEQYQQLRNAYSQLKTIESDVVNQFKSAMRNTSLRELGGDFINGLGTVDMLQGILTKSPGEILQGGTWMAITKAIKYLKDPEVNLRRAFNIIQNGEEAVGPQSTTAQRAFGVKAPEAKPPVKKPQLALPSGTSSFKSKVGSGRVINIPPSGTSANFETTSR